MPPRFYRDVPITSNVITLAGSEHHHLAKVLRLNVGDSITLFDNSGFEFGATIQMIRRDVAELVITERRAINRELPFNITLAVALPKGNRQQWLIEKAVELGVHTLTPLVTERGVARPADKALQRLTKWVISASKQCGRNRLMKIAAPQSTASFFEQNGVIVAHPDPDATKFDEFLQRRDRKQQDLFVAVGPEGGFTDAELAIAKSSGCSIVHLGTRIVRIETAALAVVAGLIYTSS